MANVKNSAGSASARARLTHSAGRAAAGAAAAATLTAAVGTARRTLVAARLPATAGRGCLGSAGPAYGLWEGRAAPTAGWRRGRRAGPAPLAPGATDPAAIRSRARPATEVGGAEASAASVRRAMGRAVIWRRAFTRGCWGPA